MLSHFLLANKQPLSSSLLQTSLVAAAPAPVHVPVSVSAADASSGPEGMPSSSASSSSACTAATTADGVLSMRSRSGSGSNSNSGVSGAGCGPSGSASASGSRDCSPVDRTKRLSIRAYLTQQLLGDGDGDGDGEDLGALDFEIQLAQGIPPSSLDATPAGAQVLDMVVMGHADGSVILWGVLMPDSGNHLGRGNVWLPLMALRCGQVCIA